MEMGMYFAVNFDGDLWRTSGGRVDWHVEVWIVGHFD